MRITTSVIVLIAGSLFIDGCCDTPKDNITLVDAMTQVGQGLRAMNNAAHPAGDKSSKSFGLYADEVTVTFNVEASKTSTSSNSLTLSADVSPPVIPVKAGLADTATNSSTSSRSRGNTIVVTLKNPAFATTGTLVHDSVTGLSSTAATTDKATTTPGVVAPGGAAPTPPPAPAAPPQPVDRAADRVKAFGAVLQIMDNFEQETAEMMKQMLN